MLGGLGKAASLGGSRLVCGRHRVSLVDDHVDDDIFAAPGSRKQLPYNKSGISVLLERVREDFVRHKQLAYSRSGVA